MKRRCLGLAIGFCVLVSPHFAQADEGSNLARDKHALASVQSFVGQWRGVGQPKRGSNQGAWTEQSEWIWRFADGRASLVCEFNGGKLYRHWELKTLGQPNSFLLIAMPTANDDTQTFSGTKTGDAIVFTADTPREKLPARITLRTVAGGDRLVALFEERLGGETYSRLAEVGATREGSSFARHATSGPECIVTGGLGTINVEHNGKKYFVCCTGCRDVFNDDPEKTIADYRDRKAAEEAERKK